MLKNTQYHQFQPWLIFWLILSGIGIVFPGNQTLAQIIPDKTLGSESSVVTPVNPQRERIDGGAIRDRNLFHSFTEFNIGEGKEAYFSNPVAIENIFSRVTGSNPSRIFGKLGVLGDANLYFLNPNGIFFGENASLDIKGSFFASTASSVNFANGENYSAINPSTPPLLSVNVKAPIGLQFEGGEGDIDNQGNLIVGKDLSLNANNLTLQGNIEAGKNLTLTAQDTVKVRDSVEKPFIAAASGNLLIQGKENVDIFALNHSNSGLFSAGDMTLSSVNPVVGDIHFWSGGNFQIEKLDKSKGYLFSFYDPIIRSQGDVSIFGYQGASLHILAGGKVDINTVIITNPDTTGGSINPVATPNLANVTLSDGTSLVIDGSKKPTLDIRDGVDPAVIGNPLGTLGDSGIFFDPSINLVNPPGSNSVATSADITIGDVFIADSNGTVLLTNQYQPNPLLEVGDITINGDGVFGIGIDARGFGSNGSDVYLDSRSNINLNGSLTNPFSGINTSAINDLSNFGSAGDITLLAGKQVSMLDNLFIATNVDGGLVGNGGNIKIKANSVFADNGVRIQSGMFGEGNTGDIKIVASDFLNLDRNSLIGTQISPEGTGNAGNLEITTGSLFVSNGSGLLSSTAGKGNSGNIDLIAQDTVKFDGASVFSRDLFFSSSAQTLVAPGGFGNAGEINISTSSLSLTNGGQLQTATDGIGNAGNVNIVANESVSFDGVGGADILKKGLPSAIFSDVGVSGIGNGGDINIKTPLLSLTNGGQIVASTFGKGDAGNLKINTRDRIIFDGIGKTGLTSSAFTRVDFGAVGNGGNIEIATKSLSLTNGAQLIADTRAEGNAGIITINALEKVTFDGKGIGLTGGELTEVLSGVFSEVSPGAIGDGNLIAINTPLLLLNNHAQISAATLGEGTAGNITVTSNSLQATKGGQIRTSTSSSKKAGNITLNIKDNITLTGTETGIFANTTENSTGNGGSIIIDPETVNIKDGARISVDSQGTGKGGDIELTAGNLNLDSGTISAKTRSNTGGDITLNIQDLLLLRNNSQISTTAGDEQFGGDGGNIKVNAPDGFIVAFPNENSDITANAFEGNGGNIDITAFGIFGIEFREKPTSLSDITASSQLGFDGNVNIETPGIEPNPETVELPEDAQSTEIAQGCQAAGEAAVAFFNIGRGGLPPQPGETLSSEDVIAAWIPLVLEEESQGDEKVSRIARSVKGKGVVFDCGNY
ncbi:MAG: filamentous hemagglutinin N-terminal domain-containing protein [Rivularia sp. (in: cyanobacteria)]